MLLADLPPELPLLLFATVDCPLDDLEPEALGLFGGGSRICMYILARPYGIIFGKLSTDFVNLFSKCKTCQSSLAVTNLIQSSGLLCMAILGQADEVDTRGSFRRCGG
jgi:hypothetical protein